MAARRPKHIPIRSCVVCRQSSDKRTLLRVVRQPEKAGGVVTADATGKLSGRGAYVCADEKCIGLAQKQKRFERALAAAPGAIGPELFENLRRQLPQALAVPSECVDETKPSVEVL